MIKLEFSDMIEFEIQRNPFIQTKLFNKLPYTSIIIRKLTYFQLKNSFPKEHTETQTVVQIWLKENFSQKRTDI